MRWLTAVLVGVVCVGLGLSAQGQAFVHPGVYVSKSQLDLMRSQVKAKKGPMYNSFLIASAGKFGKLDYEVQGPPAGGVVECGSYDKPNIGCSAQDSDSMAAYTQSLLWYITGNKQYAANAIKILNTWATQLTQYTNKNAPLKAAWGAELWPRAAEILRYSNASWKPEDIAAFSKMLTNVVLPMIEKGSGSNGNWELSMVDAMMGIAVFNEDRKLMNHAEAMWKERLPTYIYLSELDGPHPKPLPRGAAYTHWYGTTDLNQSVDGMTQETCRDLGHTSMGVGAAISAAETSHIQGGKLYEAEQKRLVAAMEFDTHLLLKKDPVPELVCGGKVDYAHSSTFVVGYNEFHNRLGIAMPYTKEWVEEYVEKDPTPGITFMIVYEALTHGENAGK